MWDEEYCFPERSGGEKRVHIAGMPGVNHW